MNVQISNVTESLPRELQRSPRRVRWRFSGDWRITLWRLALFPITLVGLFLLVAGPLRNWVVYYGDVYDGDVESVDRHFGTHRGRRTETIDVTYSYWAGGRQHFGDRQIQDAQVLQLLPAPGMQKGKVRVRAKSVFGVYWDEVLLAGEFPEGVVFEGFMLGTGPGILMLLLTFVSYRRHFKPIKRLYRFGDVAVGQVIGKTTVTRKKSTSRRIEYQFEHPKFGTIKHHVEVSSGIWQEAREGQLLTVLFSPTAKRSVPYEYGGYVCR